MLIQITVKRHTDGNPNAGHLLVNQGFMNFRFVIFEIVVSGNINLENLAFEYRRTMMKVSWGDPGQSEGFVGPFLIH